MPIHYCCRREDAKATNVGQLLEKRGKEFLGSKYREPILSFSDFQEFSVSNPEVAYSLLLMYCMLETISF